MLGQPWVQGSAPGAEGVGPASPAFGARASKPFLWYFGLVSHLISVATKQLHYCSCKQLDNT